ncbi:MAG: ABC transporter permease [Desulfobacterales bacterium]|nr:MAG: ABC transporter permease [Desulfobacterales bacterium]
MHNAHLVALKPAVASILAILCSLITSGIILLFIGRNPLVYFSLLFAKGIGTPLGVIESIIRMTPLLIISAGLLSCFSAGLWNIGVEGQFLVGAMLAGWAAPALSASLPYPIYLFATAILGIAGGMAWIFLPAVLKARYDINEIITTLMMSWVAINLTAWLVKGPINDLSSVPAQTPLIPLDHRLPMIPLTRIHVGLIMGIASLLGTHWVIRRTTLGYRFRVISANKQAALRAGMRVPRIIVYSLLISGGFAGLAGVSEVLAIKGLFQAGWNPQYGMTTIPLVFLARLNGWAVIPLAFFFSFLAVGGEFVARDLDVPVFFVHVMEGLTLLFFAASEYFAKRRILK